MNPARDRLRVEQVLSLEQGRVWGHRPQSWAKGPSVQEEVETLAEENDGTATPGRL